MWAGALRSRRLALHGTMRASVGGARALNKPIAPAAFLDSSPSSTHHRGSQPHDQTEPNCRLRSHAGCAPPRRRCRRLISSCRFAAIAPSTLLTLTAHLPAMICAASSRLQAATPVAPLAPAARLPRRPFTARPAGRLRHAVVRAAAQQQDNVVVVGAGAAGLRAAGLLHKAGAQAGACLLGSMMACAGLVALVHAGQRMCCRCMAPGLDMAAER